MALALAVYSFQEKAKGQNFCEKEKCCYGMWWWWYSELKLEKYCNEKEIVQNFFCLITKVGWQNTTYVVTIKERLLL